MTVLLFLLVFIAMAAAVLGLIKPGLVLPFLAPEKRTRFKAFGLYAAICFLCAMLLPAISPKDESDAYLAQLKEEAMQAEQTRPAAQAVSAEQINADREAVRGLYARLMGFKGDVEFHSKGFGAGLPYAHQWLQEVDAIDSRMSIKKGYSLPLASSAGYLRQLGMEYIRSGGIETAQTRDFRQFVEEGLNS